MVCTFFGHGDTSKEIEPTLRSTLIDLIENKNIDLFYVGNHGNFDRMVKSIVKDLKGIYPHIDYAVVIAYTPTNNEDSKNTVYPEEAELAPRRFAICRCNEWMINKADVVVTYVKYSFGGAVKYKELAERKGKKVINIADIENQK